MVLRGGLSNHPLENLLQCLIGHGARKDPCLQPKANTGWSDGRRKFGTVSTAIVKVLAKSEAEMSVKAIREEVEALLGGSVSRFSVSDYLLTRSKGTEPLFIRTRHGHHRLKSQDNT